MIVSDKVLAKLSDKWNEEGSFTNPWANKIGEWCINYHKRYNKAPGKNIKSLFMSWADKAKDNETVELIERFLQDLSGQYKGTKINVDYTIDQATTLFNEVELRRMIQEIEGDLDKGDIKEAYSRFNKVKEINTADTTWVDLFRDKSEVVDTFTENQESIIKYPAGAGQFWGRQLSREGFISYLAPGKRGKTFHMIDMAYRALEQRQKVAFLEIGDLSKRQIIRRFMSRVANRPFYRTTETRPFRYPIKFSLKDNVPKIKHKVIKYDDDLNQEQAWKACERLMKEDVRSLKQSFFQLLAVPNNSLSFNGMRSAIRSLERRGFVPDVIIVDYIDLFAKPPGYSSADSREAVNENWKCCRGLSQDMHNLMVTATQGNAKSYKADSLDTDHFSEDNRKFAHVTGMVGISQTAPEKEEAIQRLNWLVLREEEYSVTRFCYLANCFGITNPCLRSAMPS